MSKTENPGHYTESGTRKYQSNGPVAWGTLFRKVAGKDGREGEGIRAALAFAAAHPEKFVAWADANPLVMERQHGAKPARAVKTKPAKPPKAPKVKAAKPPKAPKAPKVRKVKAAKPEQQQTSMPEVK